jgi:hypothetical protein
MLLEETNKETIDAWDRVARTADGQVIYRHLMRLVMEPVIDLSALPVHEGSRILARQLMQLMAKGIIDSDRYCIAYVTHIAAEPERPRGVTAATAARRKFLAEQSWGAPSFNDTAGTSFGGPGGAAGNGSTGGATS